MLVKKKLLNIIENKDILRKKQKISIEICLKKKKKQKENIEEIGIET